MSEEKGMKSAFLEYMDPDGVLLRPGHYPIVGGNAVSFLTGTVDTSFTLTWEPTDGKIAKSCDLGFTYGTYKLQPKTKDTAVYGTYVSVWKKQENGEWKFVLDTGNEGVGDEKE
jgi:ketosteroid isomerase-like protein